MLSLGQKIAYAIGNLPVTLLEKVLSVWVLVYYVVPAPGGPNAGDGSGGPQPLVPALMFAFAWYCGPVANAVANPLVGYGSDRYPTRFGRRLPWMAVAGPLLPLAFALLWFPPAGASPALNGLFLAGLLPVIWVLYVAYTAPYLSLLPEIWVSEPERVQVSTWQGLVEVIGTLIALAAVPVLIAEFPRGLDLGVLQAANGYQVMGLVAAALALAALPWQFLCLRERPPAAASGGAPALGFLAGIRASFRNPSFPPYVFSNALYRMAMAMILAVGPVLVTHVLRLEESMLAPIMGAIVIGAAALFPFMPRVTARFGLRRAFLAALLLFGALLPLVALAGVAPFLGYVLAPVVEGVAGLFGVEVSPSPAFLHCCAVFTLLAAPASVFFVAPHALMAQVIDEDHRLTGLRREALYNGVEGVITTLCGWGAGLVATGVLLHLFDPNAGDLRGVLLCYPLAGAAMVVAAALFHRYPIP
ncbi:MAG: MFS transporter [Planctomycetes bacterium]|nr:MFS transporter [Planctomycetota bacterium]